MAPEETEELVDYDDAEDTYVAPTAAAGADGAKAQDKEAEKGSYVGIHSTGFRQVVTLIHRTEANPTQRLFVEA